MFILNIYLLCLKEKQICDWPSSAKCKAKKVTTTTTTSKPVQMDPILEDESEVQPPSKPIIDLIDPSSRPELLNSNVYLYSNYKSDLPKIRNINY